MAIYAANNGQLQTIKGIYYGMTGDYVNATLFHNIVPKTATEIKFLYVSNNPDLTNYQKIGYCDNNNYIEVWNNNTKYIIINPRENYIYAPVSCSDFLRDYNALTVCVFDNFDTRNVQSMYAMFCFCTSLQSLDLSRFNTQKVSTMENMFHGCYRITSIDVSNFDTGNVTNFGGMFQYCGVRRLDLSSFNTGKVLSMFNMFYSATFLASIISNTFNLTALTNSKTTFYDCTSLVGGNGTTYNSSHITAEYARVDGENGLPGYFTAPTN